MSKETYSSVKRELHMSLVFVLIPLWINKLTPFDSIASYVAKETYTSVQRDVHKWQKRPTLVSKETYTSGKRDLH